MTTNSWSFRVLTLSRGEVRATHSVFCRTKGSNIAIALMTRIIGVIAFYEKVIKVKADVAAFLD
jgi:hypothetical protein